MEILSTQARFTTLLENDMLSRLEKMRLCPRRRMTNRSRGEHHASKGGTSTEFADYRDYVPGDDVRYVDWNIFARLERPYVKLYRHEEEMHVVTIIDGSASMQFDGKFERARQLAAAIGLMGLMNVERVSAHVCNHVGTEPLLFAPCTGRVSRRRLFDFLEKLEGGGDFPIEQAVEAVLRRHRGRGIAVLLSDFLTFGDLERPLNMLFSAGLEVFAVQILAPSEINPEVTGDIRLVDCESGHTIDVSSAGDLLGIYEEHRWALEEELALLCRQRSGRFLSISSRDPLEWVLFDLFRRKGWAR
ncbi:MAG TPA: DUF58 domain-containing protein [Planctomycetaceae bacterium]|nr:DUF58 domain-containing protein [Planctomycetaceae bacterium]